MLKTVLVAGSVLAFAALVGCAGSSHRNPDWRNPRPCPADDADCRALPPLPPGGQQGTDGGARPAAPGPSIQPAPGDIQI